MELYAAEYISPLGKLLLTGTEEGLLSLTLPGSRRPPCREEGRAAPLPCLRDAEEWLDAYFAGKRPDPGEVPVCLRGSEFQKRVWRLLEKIPYGETVTYGALAGALAGEGRMSAQAVGGAVGRNPLPILLPCHRVVGARGDLTGYGGGMETKIWLLRHEGADMSRLFRPGERPAGEKREKKEEKGP